jgi:hypothetical protein
MDVIVFLTIVLLGYQVGFYRSWPLSKECERCIMLG